MQQFLGPMTDQQKKKIQACRKAVEQHPQDAEVYFHLGLACRKGKWMEQHQGLILDLRKTSLIEKRVINYANY